MPPAGRRRVGPLCRPPRRRSIPPAGRRRAGPLARPPRRRSVPPAGRTRAGIPLPDHRDDGPYVRPAPGRVGPLPDRQERRSAWPTTAATVHTSSRPQTRPRPLCPARSDDPCLRPAPDASVRFARPPPRRSVSPAGRRRAGPPCPTTAATPVSPAGARRAGPLCPTAATTVRTSSRSQTRGAPLPDHRSDVRVSGRPQTRAAPPCPTPRSDGPYVPTAPRRVGRLCPARSDDPCLRRAPDTSVPFARPPPRRSVSPAGARRAGPLCPTAATTVRTSSRSQTRGAPLPDHRSDVRVSGRPQTRAAAVVCGRCCQSAGGAGSWHAGDVDLT